MHTYYARCLSALALMLVAACSGGGGDGASPTNLEPVAEDAWVVGEPAQVQTTYRGFVETPGARPDGFEERRDDQECEDDPECEPEPEEDEVICDQACDACIEQCDQQCGEDVECFDTCEMPCFGQGG